MKRFCQILNFFLLSLTLPVWVKCKCALNYALNAECITDVSNQIAYLFIVKQNLYYQSSSLTFLKILTLQFNFSLTSV